MIGWTSEALKLTQIEIEQALVNNLSKKGVLEDVNSIIEEA